MSVAPDRPENLHPLRRPPQLGGTGKDPVWCLDLANVPQGLQFRQDSSAHGLIEPSLPMSFNEFQRWLEDSQPFWRQWP
jgi:hypothetical protein